MIFDLRNRRTLYFLINSVQYSLFWIYEFRQTRKIMSLRQNFVDVMAVIDALDSFRYPLKQEDDVTLVVIKVES